MEKDVTNLYRNMIESFECDFLLARDNNKNLNEIQELIDNRNTKIINDIDLLEKLSYGIRYGRLKIIEVKEC